MAATGKLVTATARVAFSLYAIGVVIGADNPAVAAEGAIQNAIGARYKGLSGAGVAMSTDATAASLNPAGLATIPSQINVAASVVHLDGGMSSWGGFGINALGQHDSDANWVVVPNIAANWRVNWGLIDALAFTAYGNGGVATHYGNVDNTNCAGIGSPNQGIYCGGPLGIKLSQTILSVAAAKQIAPGISVGVAPLLARQTVELNGTSLFNGYTSNPSNFSDRGTDGRWGVGVRAGAEWRIAPWLKFGIAGNSKIDVESHERYAGLLADHANLDIPPMLQLGLAWSLAPNAQLFTDYKRIWYSTVPAVSNPSTNHPAIPFGVTNGPGYGVQDVDVYKVGLEWAYRPDLTFRLGYSYNTAPILPRDVDFNIMTLGVVQHHISAGLKYSFAQRWDLELAGMFAPRASVRGVEINFPNRFVEINMEQAEVTLGLTYRFDN